MAQPLFNMFVAGWCAAFLLYHIAEGNMGWAIVMVLLIAINIAASIGGLPE
jgi:hypothetical protein